jgi:hypothetical protein
MGDELVTYFIGTLPSWDNVVEALGAGADSHGPVFHGINFLWLQSQGPNIPGEFSQRLPSVITWIVALWGLQTALKGTISPWMAAGLALSTLTWPEGRLHLAENRGYGILMMVVALTLCLNVKTVREGETWKSLAGLSLVQGIGILCHPMSGIFGAAAAFALIANQWVRGRTFWKSALAYIIGWLALTPWLFALAGQVKGALSETVRWAPAPSADLLGAWLQPGEDLVVIATLTLGLGYLLRKNPPGKQEENTAREKENTAILCWTGGVFLATGLLLWVVSQWTNPLFLERYLLPVRIGWVCLAAAGIAYVGLPERVQTWLGVGTTTILAILIMSSNPQPREMTGGFWSANPWVDAGFADAQFMKEPLPVACETSTTYLPRHHYHGDAREYFLVLDKTAADQDGGPAGMDYVMNKALAKASGSGQKIMEAQEFAQKHPRFYLLDETNSSTGTRSFPEGQFQKKEILMGSTSPSRSIRLFLVERKN